MRCCDRECRGEVSSRRRFSGCRERRAVNGCKRPLDCSVIFDEVSSLSQNYETCETQTRDDRLWPKLQERQGKLTCTFLMLGIGGIAGGMSSVVSRICRRRHLQADLDREEMHEFLVFSLYHREVE
jgi:hypothetical protein